QSFDRCVDRGLLQRPVIYVAVALRVGEHDFVEEGGLRPEGGIEARARNPQLGGEHTGRGSGEAVAPEEMRCLPQCVVTIECARPSRCSSLHIEYSRSTVP